MWTIVIESGSEWDIFEKDLSREDALSLIENRLENGTLSGKKYIKVSNGIWKHKDDIVRLLSEKGFDKWVKSKNL